MIAKSFFPRASMEDRNDHPSLPPNYVSLVQLQERWLKEQERKKREKEEIERKERENAEQERTRSQQDEENRKQNVIQETAVSRPVFRKNRRNQRAMKDQGKIKEEKSQIESLVDHDEEKKPDESKKNKKKRKTKARKPKIDENLEIETLIENSCENEGIRDQSRLDGGNRSVNNQIWEQKVSVDQTASLPQDFEGLSMNVRKESNMKRRGSGGFVTGKPRRHVHSNLVWVKKGDIADTELAGVQSSGKFEMDGRGQRSN